MKTDVNCIFDAVLYLAVHEHCAYCNYSCVLFATVMIAHKGEVWVAASDQFSGLDEKKSRPARNRKSDFWGRDGH